MTLAPTITRSRIRRGVGVVPEGDKSTTFFVRTDKLFELAGGAVKKNSLCKELMTRGIMIRRTKEDRSFQRLPGGEKVQHYRLVFPEVAECDPFA